MARGMIDTPEARRMPDLAGIEAAARKLQSLVPATPLLPLMIEGKHVWCKAESQQPVGAFKLRGAWHRLTELTGQERRRGVVAFSSGNHAQGVAWAARELGIEATIVMPSDAPRLKLEATRSMGASIVLYDRMRERREVIAAELAAAREAVVVPSFDDPYIVEGQGSCGIEAAQQMAAEGAGAPDLVIAPCGGGGLASGLALALPEARIAIVEPEGWNDMGESLRSGAIVPVQPDPPPTSCDALQTLRVSELTFGILSDRCAEAFDVSEAEIAEAMRVARSRLNLTLEPGGAVALAALVAGKIAPTANTLVILSGGNVDPEVYEAMTGLSVIA
jgi:threonine dehydratase